MERYNQYQGGGDNWGHGGSYDDTSSYGQQNQGYVDGGPRSQDYEVNYDRYDNYQRSEDYGRGQHADFTNDYPEEAWQEQPLRGRGRSRGDHQGFTRPRVARGGGRPFDRGGKPPYSGNYNSFEQSENSGQSPAWRVQRGRGRGGSSFPQTRITPVNRKDAEQFQETRETVNEAPNVFAENDNSVEPTKEEGNQEYSSVQNQENKKDDHEAETTQNQSASEENEEEDDESDEDTSFCKLCNVPFDSTEKFYRHTRGMLHTQRQMAKDEEKKKLKAAQSGQEQPEASGEQDKQPPQEPFAEASKEQDKPFTFGRGGAGTFQKPQQAEVSSEKPESGFVQRQAAASTSQGLALIGQDEDEAENEEWEEEEEDNMEDAEADKGPGEFHCKICDINATSEVSLNSHLNGRSHKQIQEAIETGRFVSKKLTNKLGKNSMLFEVQRTRSQPGFSLKTAPSSGDSILKDLVKDIKEPIVGLKCIKEVHFGGQHTFICTLCNTNCDNSSVLTHLVGTRHRLCYLREYHGATYQHVKNFGGKKSHLTAFLVQVCSDMQKEEQEQTPILEQSVEEPQLEQKAKKDQGFTPKADQEGWKPKREPERFPDRSGYGPRPQPPRDQEPHHYGPRQGYDRPPDGPYPGHRDRGRDGLPAPPPPPPFNPAEEEEVQRQKIKSFEQHLLFYPDLRISAEEARDRMFFEYKRIGLPYDIACERVRLQEARRIRLIEMIRDGLVMPDAQHRLLAEENRRKLMLDYERQGLSSTEARWRVIVEEERNRLFEDYERRRLTPLEARARIMMGQDRAHLIHEYERHGMPPQEARMRALAEEDRLKSFESSSSKGLGERSFSLSSENHLDEVADKRMLERYIDEGLSRDEAENKVILYLRREGVATQEAIARVQKINLSKKGGGEKEDRGSRGRDDDLANITPEQAKEKLLREYEKRGVSREEARRALIAELIRSGVEPEEAIRRFQDSDKLSRRAGSAEKAHGRTRRKKYTGYDRSRSSSSSSDSDLEIIRCIPPPRVSPPRSYRKDHSKRGSRKERDDCDRKSRDEDWGRREREDYGRKDRGDYDRNERNLLYRRERDSPDRREKGFPDRRDRISPERREKGYPERRDRDFDQGRGGRDFDRRERDDFDRPGLGGDDLDRRLRGDRDYSEGRDRPSRSKDERDYPSLKERSPRRDNFEESKGRPTLTLGEELRLKRKRAGLLDDVETALKRSRSAVRSNEGQAGSSGEGDKSVSNLLDTLTNNLLSSENDSDVALQVSKALTSALLKYRVNSPKEQQREAPKPSSSFVERRIDDAKKLYKDRVAPQGASDRASAGKVDTYAAFQEYFDTGSTGRQQPPRVDMFSDNTHRPANPVPARPGPQGQRFRMQGWKKVMPMPKVVEERTRGFFHQSEPDD